MLTQLDDAPGAAELTERGLRLALEARDPKPILSLLIERAWLARSQPQLKIDLQETLTMLAEYARRFDSLTATFQHRAQLFELRVQTAEADWDREDAAREIAGLLLQMSPERLWAIYPLLENVVLPAAQLQPQCLQHVIELLNDESGPFRRVGEPIIHAALGDLFQISLSASAAPFKSEAPVENAPNVAPDEQVLGILIKLCRNWPYRILNILPPYSLETIMA